MFSSPLKYFQTKKILSLILTILILDLYEHARSDLVLCSFTMTSAQQTFTIPYNQTLTAINPSFAYFIESATIKRAEFRVTHDETQTVLTKTSVTIKMILEGVPSMDGTQSVKIKLLISDYPSDQMVIGMQTKDIPNNFQIPFPTLYDSSASIKEVYWKIFTLNIPLTFTESSNTTHLTLTPIISPVALTKVTVSYIILTRVFLSNGVGIFFDKFSATNLAWIILLNNDTIVDPSPENTMLAINSYSNADVTKIIDCANTIDHDYNYPLSSSRAVYAAYTTTGTSPTEFKATMFMFSNQYQGCPTGNFLSYNTLYIGSPKQCVSCHASCRTCTSASYSLQVSDEYSCLTCPSLNYLEESSTSTGSCSCLPGLSTALDGSCLPCQFDCLSFDVHFMQSSTKSQFLILFSSASLRMLVAFDQNLEIYINQNADPVPYEWQKLKNGFYSVCIASSFLSVCNEECEINFHFKKPQKILRKNADVSLSVNSRIVTIDGYYSVADQLPDQMDQAFLISSMLVGASMGGGLSSLLKMLFELEQMIQYHKFVDLELPLIFKQFVESLNVFKFLDVTAAIPFDVNEQLMKFSSDQLDNKGPMKSIYYQNGCNFYKNIIPILVSFAIVLIINFSLFLILRAIPCKLSWKFSQKLRIRKLITILDLSQTMILPVLVFGMFQLNTMYFHYNHFLAYSFMAVFMFTIMILPFIVGTYVYLNRRDTKMKQIYEDLLQDCQIYPTGAYIFYLTTYYRKVGFALALTHGIPGVIQASALIAINGLYLGNILYVIIYKYFNSKIKMLTKTINTICVLAIEGIMLYYNLYEHSLTTMVDLGTTCVYMAIVATIAGILEALIKLCEIICQNVSENSNVESESSSIVNADEAQSVKPEKEFIDPVYCGIGKDVISQMIAIQSRETIDTTERNSRQGKRRSKRNNQSLLKRAGSGIGTNPLAIFKSNPKINKNQIGKDQSIQQLDPNEFVSFQSLDEMEIHQKNKNLNSKRVERDKERAFKFIKDSLQTNQKPSMLQSKKNSQRQSAVSPGKLKISKLDKNKNDELVIMPSNIDNEIKQTQQRIRNSMIKKRMSLREGANNSSNQSPPKRGLQRMNSDTRAHDLIGQRRIQKPTNQLLQSNTKRLIIQEEDQLQNQINQKSTRRKRQSKKGVVAQSMHVNNNKKRYDDEDQQGQQEIYYVKQ